MTMTSGRTTTRESLAGNQISPPPTVASTFSSSSSTRGLGDQLDALCVRTILERYPESPDGAGQAEVLSTTNRSRSASEVEEIFRGLEGDAPSSAAEPREWATLGAWGACGWEIPSSEVSPKSDGDTTSQGLSDSPPSVARTRTVADIEAIYQQLREARGRPEMVDTPSRNVVVIASDLGVGGVRLLERMCARRIQRAWRAYAKRQETVKMYERTAERCRHLVEATLLQTAVQNSRIIEKELATLKARRKSTGRIIQEGQSDSHNPPSSSHVTYTLGRFLLIKPLASPQALNGLTSALVAATAGEDAVVKHREYSEEVLTLIIVARAPTRAVPPSQPVSRLSGAAVVAEYVRAFDEGFAEAVRGSLWELTLQARKRAPARWRYINQSEPAKRERPSSGNGPPANLPRSLRRGFPVASLATVKKTSKKDESASWGEWSLPSWLNWEGQT
ncbi:hypothetical protein FOZ63_030699 [Perkinsus olseni]|uniref:Uncharacterized protein n=1 Tax=Perkinsus olseni TaxID=32597 RepID=A0A7J6U8D5_PEROL|nr:hypothetical protein FOZ62_024157 [Perkinsus olseni]KAF4753708.1 hypothetical protein FOZ63_030699 [Perkinsus olseni]